MWVWVTLSTAQPQKGHSSRTFGWAGGSPGQSKVGLGHRNLGVFPKMAQSGKARPAAHTTQALTSVYHPPAPVVCAVFPPSACVPTLGAQPCDLGTGWLSGTCRALRDFRGFGRELNRKGVSSHQPQQMERSCLSKN